MLQYKNNLLLNSLSLYHYISFLSHPLSLYQPLSLYSFLSSPHSSLFLVSSVA